MSPHLSTTTTPEHLISKPNRETTTQPLHHHNHHRYNHIHPSLQLDPTITNISSLESVFISWLLQHTAVTNFYLVYDEVDRVSTILKTFATQGPPPPPPEEVADGEKDENDGGGSEGERRGGEGERRGGLNEWVSGPPPRPPTPSNPGVRGGDQHQYTFTTSWVPNLINQYRSFNGRTLKVSANDNWPFFGLKSLPGGSAGDVPDTGIDAYLIVGLVQAGGCQGTRRQRNQRNHQRTRPRRVGVAVEAGHLGMGTIWRLRAGSSVEIAVCRFL
ncbi:hypothetical protein Pmani_004518 [Petrolisthes manimaculis]|uniref:Uncharacterized protein n=1 Tax=Petrolisthes manimaculis TaxID=1843537 RepID=A0AAE1QG28_9EUCA|nr:hypothetical protein Pmani_004518 [Petrolisthes manimaculis]